MLQEFVSILISYVLLQLLSFKVVSQSFLYIRAGYRNYIVVGLGSLSQAFPLWLTTESKDLMPFREIQGKFKLT